MMFYQKKWVILWGNIFLIILFFHEDKKKVVLLVVVNSMSKCLDKGNVHTVYIYYIVIKMYLYITLTL